MIGLTTLSRKAFPCADPVCCQLLAGINFTSNLPVVIVDTLNQKVRCIVCSPASVSYKDAGVASNGKGSRNIHS
jgi:hypothetical protein